MLAGLAGLSRSSRRMVWVAAALASLLAGCDDPPRVACLGDSNTDSRWQLERYPDTGFPERDGWCERLRNFGIDSRSWGQSRATLLSYPWQGHNSLRGANGEQQLNRVIADGESNIVIISLGTNDMIFTVQPVLLFIGVTVLINKAEANGLTAYLATVPFTSPDLPHARFDADVAEFNALILGAYPGRIIDFNAVAEQVGDYLDQVHVGGEIHAQWSAKAAETIWSDRVARWTAPGSERRRPNPRRPAEPPPVVRSDAWTRFGESSRGLARR